MLEAQAGECLARGRCFGEGTAAPLIDMPIKNVGGPVWTLASNAPTTGLGVALVMAPAVGGLRSPAGSDAGAARPAQKSQMAQPCARPAGEDELGDGGRRGPEFLLTDLLGNLGA